MGTPRSEYAPPSRAVAPDRRMEELAASDPLAFLRECIARYEREVHGYSCSMIKQERLAGALMPTEVIRSWFKEKPFSVRMDWERGARAAAKTLYVEGENKGMIWVKPAGILAIAGIVVRDPLGGEARSSARYPITEFGIQIGTLSTLKFWEEADQRGELRVEFEGLVPVPELGGLKCWKLHRLEYARPEVDGITSAVFYFDPASWLQVGSVLRGKDGKLIGRYFFKNLRLNPKFPPDTFRRAGLLK